MRTAVALATRAVLSGKCDWEDNPPRFRIRTREFDFGEVRRYYNRKSIDDPIQHFRNNLQDESQLSKHIVLLAGRTPNAHSPTGLRLQDSSSTMNSPIADPQMSQIALQENAVPSLLPSPSHLTVVEKLVWCAGAYCANFVESVHAGTRPREPPVHMHTLQGKLANQVQDGLFHASQMQLSLSQESFGQACDMMPSVFQEITPMALAQILTVMCELLKASHHLSTTHAQPNRGPFLAGISRLLLKHLEECARIGLSASHPLVTFFDILQSTADPVGALVQSVHRMTDQMIVEKHYWTHLYLLERYSDCLYHADISGERHARRGELLALQEQAYGKIRSNVLWTLTNVADDYLENNQFEKAEAAFRDAINRADYGLGGYAKAKIRFAAFEGLARVAMVKSDVEAARAIWKHSASGFVAGLRPPTESRIRGLDEALAHLNVAEQEALSRDDFSERRLARVCRSKETIQGEIDDLRLL